PELGDAADRLERRDGVGRPTPGGASLGLGGRDGERVADVEQHLEQELLALIGGVDVGHPGLVAGGLGALVGLAVNRLELSQAAPGCCRPAARGSRWAGGDPRAPRGRRGGGGALGEHAGGHAAQEQRRNQERGERPWRVKTTSAAGRRAAPSRKSITSPKGAK